MTNELSPEDQAIVDEILKRRRSADQKWYPAEDVARFRQAITAELARSGELTKEAVESLLKQFYTGKL